MNKVPTIYELVRVRKRLRRARSISAPWGRSTLPLALAALAILALVALPSGGDGVPWLGATARAAFDGRSAAARSWGTRILVLPVINECQDPEAGKAFVAALATVLQPRGLRLVAGASVEAACRREGLKADLVGPGPEMARLLERSACQGALRIRFQTLLPEGSDEVKVGVRLRGYAGDGRSVFSRKLSQGFDGSTLLEDAVSLMARKAARIVDGHRAFYAGGSDRPMAPEARIASATPAPSVASAPPAAPAAPVAVLPSVAPVAPRKPAAPAARPRPVVRRRVAGFVDVPGEHWARGALERLRRAGIIEGLGETFEGRRSLTRYEMAVLADRFLSALRALESRMMKETAPSRMAGVPESPAGRRLPDQG